MASTGTLLLVATLGFNHAVLDFLFDDARHHMETTGEEYQEIEEAFLDLVGWRLPLFMASTGMLLLIATLGFDHAVLEFPFR